MAITIERAEPRDRQELAAMYATDMNALGIERSPEDLLPLVDLTLENQGQRSHCWVARSPGDELVGVLLASPFMSLKVVGWALWIEELYVRPDCRRRGIAQELVEAALDWAEENDFKGVELEAYHMNTGASVLYRSLGFRRLARERYCYYYGVDDL